MAGFRVEVDERSERMNAVRNAQLQKVPYMLVVGDREERLGSVSVRLRTNEDSLTELSDFMDHLHEVVAAKSGCEEASGGSGGRLANAPPGRMVRST